MVVVELVRLLTLPLTSLLLCENVLMWASEWSPFCTCSPENRFDSINCHSYSLIRWFVAHLNATIFIASKHLIIILKKYVTNKWNWFEWAATILLWFGWSWQSIACNDYLAAGSHDSSVKLGPLEPDNGGRAHESAAHDTISGEFWIQNGSSCERRAIDSDLSDLNA